MNKDLIIEQQAAEIESLKAYCNKLAAGYPDGMLPTDIQVIKDANWTFAQQLHEAQAEIERMRGALEKIIGRPHTLFSNETWVDPIERIIGIAKDALKGGE